jgi:hypothetical protein
MGSKDSSICRQWWFMAVMTRHAGFATIGLGDKSIANLVLFIVTMSLAPVPFMVTLRVSQPQRWRGESTPSGNTDTEASNPSFIPCQQRSEEQMAAQNRILTLELTTLEASDREHSLPQLAEQDSDHMVDTGLVLLRQATRASFEMELTSKKIPRWAHELLTNARATGKIFVSGALDFLYESSLTRDLLFLCA